MKLYVLVLSVQCLCAGGDTIKHASDVRVVPAVGHVTIKSNSFESYKETSKVEFTTDFEVAKEKMIAGYQGWEINFWKKFQILKLEIKPEPLKYVIISPSDTVKMEVRP